jgi:CubicO group peptidase (beta-lactamase class C family)
MGTTEELEVRLSAAAERHGVPGAAVGVLHDGVEAYAYYGVTSVEHPLPVDGGTLFQIGSTTKTFTATAIMRLVERGDVDLAAPVRTYVPELRLQDEDVAARVTVLDLLNHTAGWDGDFFIDTGGGDDAIERYVARLVEVPQVAPLGAIASYNNAAFVLAGLVIERATGGTYEAALSELVLEPLGLRESFLRPVDVMTRRFASGHQHHGGRPEVARQWALARSAWPAGGIAATARDQLRYARFHLGDGTWEGRRLLRAETMELMRRPTAELGGGALGEAVGIAWLLQDIGGVRLVRHGGGTNGQLSVFAMVPERAFAIAILTNSDTGSQLNAELQRWALEAYLGVTPGPDPEPLDLPADRLSEYAGRYRTTNGHVDVTVEDGRLVARHVTSEEGRERMRSFHGGQAPEQPPLPLGMLPGDRFVIVEGRARGSRGRFIREAGAVTALELSGRVGPRA